MALRLFQNVGTTTTTSTVKRSVPYRYKSFGNEGAKQTETGNESFSLSDDTIDEILKLTKLSRDMGVQVFSTLLGGGVNNTNGVNVVLFGKGDRDNERKLLNYLTCLQHGLERDSEIEKRILFSKITELINLLSRDLRWPDKLFDGKCTHASTCTCDTDGKGCRTKRLFEMSLARLKLLQQQQEEFRNKLDKVKYVGMVEVPKQRKERTHRANAKEEQRKPSPPHHIRNVEIKQSKVDDTTPAPTISRETHPTPPNDPPPSNSISSREKEDSFKDECLPAVYHVTPCGDVITPLTDDLEPAGRLSRSPTVVDLWRKDDEALKCFDNKDVPHMADKKTKVEGQVKPESGTNVPKLAIRTDTNDAESNKHTQTISIDIKKQTENENRKTINTLLPILQKEKIKTKTKKKKTIEPLPEITKNEKKIDENKENKKNREETIKKKKKTTLSKKKTKLKKHVRKMKTKIEIPKELTIEDNLLTPKRESGASSYRAPPLSSICTEPSHLDVDLGTLQPVYKIIIQIKETAYSTISIGNSSDQEDLVISPRSISSLGSYDGNAPTIRRLNHRYSGIDFEYFKVEYSSDCVDWIENQIESCQICETYDGEVIITLQKEIDARYLRLHAQNNKVLKNILVRVEREDSSPECNMMRNSKTPASRSGQSSVLPVPSPQEERCPTENERCPTDDERCPTDNERCPTENDVVSTTDATTELMTDVPTDVEKTETPTEKNLPEVKVNTPIPNKFQDDLLVKIKEDIRPHSRVLPRRKKVSLFPTFSREGTGVENKEPINDESEEEGRIRRMMLERKRRARQKVEAMMNFNGGGRKKHEEESVGEEEGEIDDSKKGQQNHDLDFLRKYCIISKHQREWYERLFKMYQEAGDEATDDSLSVGDAFDAINVANRTLVSNGKLHYIISVMSLLGVPLTDRIDIRAFILLLAFSEKILSLGKFFHLSVERVDYGNLLRCLIKAKQLYQIMLRNDQECTIHIEDFLIELSAAKITQKEYIVDLVTMGNQRRKLDFLDYLTYFPLFIYTHDTITNAPVT